MSDPLGFIDELKSESFAASPDRACSKAHRSGAPDVFDNPFDEGVIVCRHSLISAIGRHPAFQAQNRASRSMGPSAGGALSDLFAYHPVFHNEPLHRELRQKAFRAIGWKGPETVRKVSTQIANDLLKEIELGRTFDVIKDFAHKFSSQYWCRCIGLPQTYAGILARAASKLGLPLAFRADAEDLSTANEGAELLVSLFTEALRDLQSISNDAAVFCIDPTLRDAPLQEKQSAIRMLAAMSFDVVDGIGGLISNAVYWLTKDQNLQSLIVDDQTKTGLIWAETARLTPPILGLYRCPTEDTEIAGNQFKKGTNILLLNAAGNRDPNVFSRPDAFDCDRDFSKLLSFGQGRRACIGRSINRITTEAALEAIIGVGFLEREGAHQLYWGKAGLARSVQRLDVKLISHEARRDVSRNSA